MDDFDKSELENCVDVLKKLAENPYGLSQLPEHRRIEFLKSAGQLIRPDRMTLKQARKVANRKKRKETRRVDSMLNQSTLIRKARNENVFQAPEFQPELLGTTIGELSKARRCYVCKTEYRSLHFYYDSMCVPCGDFNYRKRFQLANLKGSRALVTGARVKIGYQTALKLLRCGAEVVATTRFPVDAVKRYAAESDYTDWKDRLHIFGLDLRHTPSVETFVRLVCENFEALDILINNAAQTVRRPPGFYSHLLNNEQQGITSSQFPEVLGWYRSALNQLRPSQSSKTNAHQWLIEGDKNEAPGIQDPARLSLIPYDFHEKDSEFFPKAIDADLQQVDLRSHNTWRMALEEVSTSEMLEVHLINAVAPFVLCSRLKSLLKTSKIPQRHIVNASAMEGKFTRFTKTDKHPHTNMAKAALNMLSLTSSGDYAKDAIYMNAVDTGWVTDEDPHPHANRKQTELDFQPPLDIVDGAARLLDPVIEAASGKSPVHGKFLKDYQQTSW